jgi:hypothetical protein
MSRVLVIQLPDINATDEDWSNAMKAFQEALGRWVGGCHVYGAVAEDADSVLAVFTPDPQERP